MARLWTTPGPCHLVARCLIVTCTDVVVVWAVKAVGPTVVPISKLLDRIKEFWLLLLLIEAPAGIGVMVLCTGFVFTTGALIG